MARQIFNKGVSRTTKQIRDLALKVHYDPCQVFFSVRQRRKNRDAGTGTGDNLYQLLRKLYVDNKV